MRSARSAIAAVGLLLAGGSAMLVGPLGEPAAALTECSDGVDNDSDGKVDYPTDPGCSSATDSTEGPTCSPLAPEVIVCLTRGSVAASYEISAAGTSPTGIEHDVAGYVDLYRFVLADVTTTLPCVRLLVDSVAPDPCQAAGGTFVSRLATLVETSVEEPGVVAVPVETIAICNAELTATVSGVGINSAAAYTTC